MKSLVTNFWYWLKWRIHIQFCKKQWCVKCIRSIAPITSRLDLWVYRILRFIKTGKWICFKHRVIKNGKEIK